MQAAKDLDAVRATKASDAIQSKMDAMKDQKGGPELQKVVAAAGAITQPSQLCDGLLKVMDAADEAFKTAPGSKKMADNVLKLFQQMCQKAKAHLPVLMDQLDAAGAQKPSFDLAAAAKVVEGSKRLDEMAGKLAVLMGSTWDPPLAPGLEKTLADKAAQVFQAETSTAKHEDAFTAQDPMTSCAALQVLSPWWPSCKDVDGCNKRLTSIFEVVETECMKVYKDFKAQGNDDVCKMIFGLCESFDAARNTFVGFEYTSPSSSICGQLTAGDKEVGLEIHLKRLEDEVVKAASASGAISLEVVLGALEGLALVWEEATKSGTAPVDRLVAAAALLETWTLGLCAKGGAAEVEDLKDWAVRYDATRGKLAPPAVDGLSLGERLTKAAPDAKLAIVEGELGKEKGMNPKAIEEALNALVRFWEPPVSTIESFTTRLSSVFATLRDRMADSCAKFAAADEADKLKTIIGYTERFNKLQEALGNASPAFLSVVACAGADTDLKDVELELAKETGRDIMAVIRSIQNLKIYWPHIFPPDTLSDDEAQAQVKARLEKAYSVVTEDMVKAYVAGDDTKKGKLLLFADTFRKACDGLSGVRPPEIRATLVAAGEGAPANCAGTAPVADAAGTATAADGASPAPVDLDDASAAAKSTASLEGIEATPALREGRALLEAMKPSEVRKLARSLDISEEARDRALDAEDPGAALVALVWAVQKPVIEAQEEEIAKYKAMKTGELAKLARSMGIDEEARDAALDADDPHSAFIQLILVNQKATASAEADAGGAAEG